MKNKNEDIEKRTFEIKALSRAENEPLKLEGYAVVFEQKSSEMFGFYEVVKRGALDGVVVGADVRALFNHDYNIVLGRTKSGTLKLDVTEIGLRAEITLPDTQQAKDLYKLVERGDINQMSFAFTVNKDGQKWVETKKHVIREITKIDKLYDVSVVTVPAYPTTSVYARSMTKKDKKIENDSKVELINKFNKLKTSFKNGGR